MIARINKQTAFHIKSHQGVHHATVSKKSLVPKTTTTNARAYRSFHGEWRRNAGTNRIASAYQMNGSSWL